MKYAFLFCYAGLDCFNSRLRKNGIMPLLDPVAATRAIAVKTRARIYHELLAAKCVRLRVSPFKETSLVDF